MIKKLKYRDQFIKKVHDDFGLNYLPGSSSSIRANLLQNPNALAQDELGQGLL